MNGSSTPGERTNPRRFTARAREILIAALLTLAAVGFIAAALLRGDTTAQLPSGVETARKPPSN
jgi:hypothetical protein